MVHQNSLAKLFSRVATTIAHGAGKPIVFVLALVVVVCWAALGPAFSYSNTWQLFINTGTTIVTFLMVFLIQNTQNRDGAALQAKLDEIIRTTTAEDRFMGIESLTEEEILGMREHFRRLAKSKQDAS